MRAKRWQRVGLPPVEWEVLALIAILVLIGLMLTFELWVPHDELRVR